jgi:hypothetical protein
MTPLTSPKSHADMVMEDLLKSKGFSDNQVKLIQESNFRDNLRKQKMNKFSTSPKFESMNKTVFGINHSNKIESSVKIPEMKNKIINRDDGVPDTIIVIKSVEVVKPENEKGHNIEKAHKKEELLRRVSTAELWPSENTSTTKSEQPTTSHNNQHHHEIKIEPKIIHSTPSIDILLALQKAKHGISMYDIITPSSLKQIHFLMKSQHLSHDEAALILFEKFTANFQRSVSHNQDDGDENEDRSTALSMDLKCLSLDSFAVTPEPPVTPRQHYTDKSRSMGLTIKPPEYIHHHHHHKESKKKDKKQQQDEDEPKTYCRTNSENSMSPVGYGGGKIISPSSHKTSSLSKRNPFAQDRVVASPAMDAGLNRNKNKVTTSSHAGMSQSQQGGGRGHHSHNHIQQSHHISNNISGNKNLNHHHTSPYHAYTDHNTSHSTTTTSPSSTPSSGTSNNTKPKPLSSYLDIDRIESKDFIF